MDLKMRGWSINSYCLSEAWFRFKSVYLRAMDIRKITSNIKSGLYVDMLIKLEMIIYSSAVRS